MKKILSFVFYFLLSHFLLAQSPIPKGFKEQQWKSNRLRFLLPSSMKVVTNTKEELLAQNNRSKFDIFAVNEEVNDAKSYIQKLSAVLENAKEPEKTFLPEFEAWIIEGDFLDEKAVFCLLLDPKSPKKNYFVQVFYGKGVSKETAITMIGTISKI